MADRTAWEERRTQALRDLIELERQREAGEMDDETAARLRSGYLAEAAAAEEALSGLEVGAEPEMEGEQEAVAAPSRQTMLRGVALTVAAGLVLAAAILFIVELPDTGDSPVESGEEAQQDLSSLSVEELERIVSDFPEVVHTRLALARRYFLENDYQAAFPHYLQVIDRDPDNADALSDLGWMVFVSGDPATAASLLGQALDAVPGDPQATLYLAVVRMRGLDDPEGALALLDELTASGDVPEDLLPQIDSLRQEARAGA